MDEDFSQLGHPWIHHWWFRSFCGSLDGKLHARLLSVAEENQVKLDTPQRRLDELMATFGDNDRLAAMVTNLLQAPLLVILSDVEGLYDRDPADPEAKVIPTVTQLDEAIRCLVFDKKSGLSKGGMASKLEAARI
ncbi:MAG: hypothetical protein IIB59_07565, partial [Planctomycetes bacterium]|nr:hypothetical protein [Planctomycetota bacterium]